MLNDSYARILYVKCNKCQLSAAAKFNYIIQCNIYCQVVGKLPSYLVKEQLSTNIASLHTSALHVDHHFINIFRISFQALGYPSRPVHSY